MQTLSDCILLFPPQWFRVMEWDVNKLDWPYSNISRFSYSRPYDWHFQDSRDVNKPTLLLIHGTGSSTHSWRLLIPKLIGSFRIVAIDLPGHGFTKTKNHNRSSLEMMAQDLEALLRKEKINPVVIVGHSAGAALGFRLALNKKKSDTSVIAINGVLNNYFEGLSGFLYPIAAKALATNPLSAPFMAKINRATNQTKKLNDITGSKIDKKSLSFYHRLFSNVEHLSGTLAMMSQWKLDLLNRDLTNFRQASLFLIGGNDKMVSPKALKDYASLVRNSLVRIEVKLGHLMHEESPSIVSKHILEFYKSLQ